MTIASSIVSLIAVTLALHLSPLPADAREQVIPIAWLICLIVPVLVAFPIACLMQRDRNTLAKTVQMLEVAHVELDRRARTDPLTGLLNRGAFMSDVDEILQASFGGAMLMIDADNFKVVNDTYGHAAGDEALRLVAETIAAGVRKGDICGRVGGEEFLVFVPATDLQSLTIIAERILRGVCDLNFEPERGVRHRLSVSIGVAIDSGGLDANAMFSVADQKMYEAKHCGRNRIRYSSALPKAAIARAA